MANKHAKYTPRLCGVDMFGNKVYEGDWYVHKLFGGWRVHEATFAYRTELKLCAKYPKNLGKSEKAVKGFRKLCGWEA